MNINVRSIPLRRASADVVVCFVLQDRTALHAAAKQFPGTLGIRVRRVIELGDFRGKHDEASIFYPEKSLPFGRLVLVGLGEQKKLRTETLRRAGAIAAKKAHAMKARSLVFFLPHLSLRADEIAEALVEGATLGLYRYDKYRTKSEEDNTSRVDTLTVVTDQPRNVRAVARSTERANIVCEATILARDMGNAPANDLSPEALATLAQESGERAGYSVTVLKEAEIKELGMGGVLAVAQGSSRPPRFLVLEYGDTATRPVVLVGKGVCFDSGGISIKSAAGMAEMKMDMSGAAAVIGTFEAVSRLKLPVHMVGLIPAVENMPGGNATKPGDIVRHYNGKTSEVDNTDAEGRLILADALGYAEKFRPAAVIDLATLTGAVVVALGHHATGMLGNDRGLITRLKQAGEQTYERVWELPLFDEYEQLIRSDVADVKNVGGRWAGAITGAWFLKKFIGKYKWVHLDIAGTAIVEESTAYIPKGASGVGVRLLTEFFRRWR